MPREVKLNELRAVLSEAEYPIDREAVIDRFGDLRLVLADGEVELGEVVADSGEDGFDSADELGNQIRNGLPRRAVGDPYQSEGEG